VISKMGIFRIGIGRKRISLGIGPITLYGGSGGNKKRSKKNISPKTSRVSGASKTNINKTSHDTSDSISKADALSKYMEIAKEALTLAQGTHLKDETRIAAYDATLKTIDYMIELGLPQSIIQSVLEVRKTALEERDFLLAGNIADCKWCSENGAVSSRGLCEQCEFIITQDIEQRARIIQDSLTIGKNSKNQATKSARLDLVIEHAKHLEKYTNIGIPTTTPPPSRILELANIEKKRDSL